MLFFSYVNLDSVGKIYLLITLITLEETPLKEALSIGFNFVVLTTDQIKRFAYQKHLLNTVMEKSKVPLISLEVSTGPILTIGEETALLNLILQKEL